MRPFSRFVLALVIGANASLAHALPAKGTVPATIEQPVTRMIVKLRSAAAGDTIITPAAKIAALAENTGVQLQMLRSMSGGATVVKLPEATSPVAAEAIARRLSLSPDVEFASPDYLSQASLTPNDPYFAAQWGVMAPTDSSGGETTVGGANLTGAWDLSTGSSGTVVAVVDTGILPHPEIVGRLLPGYDFVSDTFMANDGNGRDSDPSDPGDWVTSADLGQPVCGNSSARASSWHGTHVAGIAAATGNNGSGVAGASWSTRILPVRVLGKCGGFDSDIIDGIRWAAGLSVSGAPTNPYPADVINLSLGGTHPCSTAMQAALDEVYAAGVTVVAATGNSYAYTVSSPASCSHVIAVTAHTVDGTSAIYANVGTQTAISAPGGGDGTDPSGNPRGSGVMVLSLGNSGSTSPATNALVYLAGTSMATPHVAGTVALLRALVPGLNPDYVRNLITGSARAFPAGSWCTLAAEPQYGKCGAGLLDAGQALQAAHVFAANHAPLATFLPVQKIGADGTLQFNLPTSDADGDTLHHVAVELPEGAALSSSGTFTWADAKPGKYVLTYSVDDGISVTGPMTVMISVGDPPSNDSGGGAFSPFLLLLLGIARWRIRRLR